VVPATATRAHRKVVENGNAMHKVTERLDVSRPLSDWSAWFGSIYCCWLVIPERSQLVINQKGRRMKRQTHSDFENPCAAEIKRISQELYHARSTIIRLMPDEVQTILRSFHACQSLQDTYNWPVTVAEQIIARAEILPEGASSYSGDRARCPLCKGESSASYVRGFSLPRGLLQHLLGEGNARQCRVMEAVPRCKGFGEIRRPFQRRAGFCQCFVPAVRSAVTVASCPSIRAGAAACGHGPRGRCRAGRKQCVRLRLCDACSSNGDAISTEIPGDWMPLRT
jgi:hypothetical protein